MMQQNLMKKFSNVVTILLMFSFLIINIGSYRDNTQHKTNGLYANSGKGHVVVTKVGYHKNGTIVEAGIEGVSFNLYKVTSEGNIQIGNTLTTDENGKLLLSGLDIGDYYLEELGLPQGYEYEKDAGGNSVNKFTFRIVNEDMDAPIQLEIKNIKSEGSFTINKELVNADGSTLTETQKQEEFEFLVLFGEKVSNIEHEDETLYSYSVNGGSPLSIRNGETIKLKSGETASFDYLKPLTKYKVVELERNGYYVSSHNNEGVFIDNSNVRFVNTKVSEGTGSIVIHKHVKAYGDVELPNDAYDKIFEFQVFIDSDKSYPAKIDGQGAIQIRNGDFVYLKHGQSIAIFDLPYGMDYSVIESNYEVDGYVAETEKFEANIGSNSLPMHYYFNNIFTGIDNNIEEEVNFNVSKQVLNSNEMMSKFEFYIDFDTDKEINYQIDGGQLISHNNDTPIYISHGQTIKFVNVPIGTKYIVKETESDGYDTLVNLVEGTAAENGTHVVIKNFSTAEIVKDSTIIVSKTVVGKQTDKRFSFMLTLGSRVEEFTLAHGESLKFSVPVGTKYSIVETDYLNEGYTPNISNGSGITKEFEVISIDVVNTYDYRNEKVNVSGTKNWDVGEKGLHYIPESITLDIYANGDLVKSVDVFPNEDGQWFYEELLPKYTQDQNEIEYTIKERNIENFESKVEGFDITNTLTLPTSYAPKVTKIVEGDALDKEVEFAFSIESLGDSPIHDKSLVKIVGEGSADFAELKFEREGTFKYLIKELDGKVEGFTYDENTVVVTINIIREGYQLIVDSVEYLKQNGGSEESALFTNIYKKITHPEIPEEPGENEEPNLPEVPEEKPSKPETPNGSGGGSQIGDLPHTGVAKSNAVMYGTLSILAGVLLILYKKNRNIKKHLREELNQYEKK